MSLDLLVNQIHLIPVIARLKYDEFAYMVPGKNVEQFEDGLRTHLNHTELPLTYVRVNELQEFIGTFSLRLHDLDSHRHLTPWLASVVVSPDQRRQWIGEYLVREAEKKAAEMGIKTLYLFTPNKEAWYQKLGWQTIEKSFLNTIPITIMQKQLVLN